MALSMKNPVNADNFEYEMSKEDLTQPIFNFYMLFDKRNVQ